MRLTVFQLYVYKAVEVEKHEREKRESNVWAIFLFQDNDQAFKIRSIGMSCNQKNQTVQERWHSGLGLGHLKIAHGLHHQLYVIVFFQHIIPCFFNNFFNELNHSPLEVRGLQKNKAVYTPVGSGKHSTHFVCRIR